MFLDYDEIIFEQRIHDKATRFGGNEYVTIQNLAAMTKQTITGLAPTLSSQKEGRVRTGDIDIDGFPDLFLTVNMATVDGNTIRRSYLMSNEECTD